MLRCCKGEHALATMGCTVAARGEPHTICLVTLALSFLALMARCCQTKRGRRGAQPATVISLRSVCIPRMPQHVRSTVMARAPYNLRLAVQENVPGTFDVPHMLLPRVAGTAVLGCYAAHWTRVCEPT